MPLYPFIGCFVPPQDSLERQKLELVGLTRNVSLQLETLVGSKSILMRTGLSSYLGSSRRNKSFSLCSLGKQASHSIQQRILQIRILLALLLIMLPQIACDTFHRTIIRTANKGTPRLHPISPKWNVFVLRNRNSWLGKKSTCPYYSSSIKIYLTTRDVEMSKMLSYHTHFSGKHCASSTEYSCSF
jgi:hypothetical protein